MPMSDRTLSEIINAVRDGKDATRDEMRYAICALDALGTFDRMAIEKAAKDSPAAWARFEDCFNRTKRALSTPPKKYVGWNNDPDNPEFVRRRQMGKRLVDKLFMGAPDVE